MFGSDCLITSFQDAEQILNNIMAQVVVWQGGEVRVTARDPPLGEETLNDCCIAQELWGWEQR